MLEDESNPDDPCVNSRVLTGLIVGNKGLEDPMKRKKTFEKWSFQSPEREKISRNLAAAGFYSDEEEGVVKCAYSCQGTLEGEPDAWGWHNALQTHQLRFPQCSYVAECQRRPSIYSDAKTVLGIQDSGMTRCNEDYQPKSLLTAAPPETGVYAAVSSVRHILINLREHADRLDEEHRYVQKKHHFYDEISQVLPFLWPVAMAALSTTVVYAIGKNGRPIYRI
ncbi:uncharacterized protein LOC106163493 [Lingula anatina]|uniref:Uncharacterized protein LOC106163493 n=1 Tax=Lingula anatina TaxID=7574 RepID=A0A1S3IEH1_LINAN|nr:uncharacterized protein LOC106163493 [Lingula anatina]|eukprot:XP_013396548.1 uncharacterized protein LOC106163493 [Lingula anatina]